MQVQSLGYRTELIFPAFDGEIIDRGDYLVVKTPSNPTFYWGNFLLFSHPPEEGDYLKWQELFNKEIGGPPVYEHKAFGWDTTGGEIGAAQPFVESGFLLEVSSVLTARGKDLISKFSPDSSLRFLTSDDDWHQAIENQVACREPIFSEAGYRVFRQRQMQRYREMVSAGRGVWFGAFIGQQLVADLGIFWEGELARYQSVQTHPNFRRRGIASALLFTAGKYALDHTDSDDLVIVSESGSEAERLYQGMGFQVKEQQVGLWISELSS
ncbi:MAG: GNAT family N-acetyltransferase [Chloroflexota bacterium]|nr:MAG: GNAT family N-acetyltransferase [Chloroflexota bacterium]